MSATTCWLVFDEIGASFPGVGAPASTAVTAIRLTGYQPVAGVTEWLRYPEVRADRVWLLDRAGQGWQDLPCAPGEPIWTHLPFDQRPDARRVGPAVTDDRPTPPRVVPTFLVTEEQRAGGPHSHVYSCSRIRESGLLFSRIWSGATPAGTTPVASIRRACAEQPVLLRRFTDESVQTTRYESDLEIELKLTLQESVSPWEIAYRLAEAVQSRRVQGFLPDLGNELQRWTYDQYTFEVLAPEEKSGYVAFMSDADGTHVVKYKHFAEDALRRTERFEVGITIAPEQFAEYLQTVIPGAVLRPLPHLVRTRFDVNVESAATGHFFGLEMDEVRADGRSLQQLEIEYHKTRAAYGAEGASIDAELSRIADQAQKLLAEWGITTQRGYLSKLSFLREVAAAG